MSGPVNGVGSSKLYIGLMLVAVMTIMAIIVVMAMLFVDMPNIFLRTLILFVIFLIFCNSCPYGVSVLQK